MHGAMGAVSEPVCLFQHVLPSCTGASACVNLYTAAPRVASSQRRPHATHHRRAERRPLRRKCQHVFSLCRRYLLDTLAPPCPTHPLPRPAFPARHFPVQLRLHSTDSTNDPMVRIYCSCYFNYIDDVLLQFFIAMLFGCC